MLEVLSVSVVEPEPEIDAGLNAAVAPDGNPAAVNVTAPPKLFMGAIVTAYCALEPAATV